MRVLRSPIALHPQTFGGDGFRDNALMKAMACETSSNSASKFIHEYYRSVSISEVDDQRFIKATSAALVIDSSAKRPRPMPTTPASFFPPRAYWSKTRAVCLRSHKLTRTDVSVHRQSSTRTWGGRPALRLCRRNRRQRMARCRQTRTSWSRRFPCGNERQRCN